VTLAQPTTPQPRIVLADDHKATTEQLVTLLEPHFEVVAVVADGRALVAAAAKFSPDVIVADIAMPFIDGLEATAMIMRCDPAARIVLVTMYAEPILIEQGWASGASAYVLKDSAGDELVEAIRAVLCGKRYLSRALWRSGDEATPQ